MAGPRERRACARDVVALRPLAALPPSDLESLDERSLSPRLDDDRSLSRDIELVAVAVRDGSLVAAVEAEVGELA